MERQEIEIGSHYLCHEANFQWFFVGQAMVKKEQFVLVKVIKCHPSDWIMINQSDSILNIEYKKIIEDASF